MDANGTTSLVGTTVGSTALVVGIIQWLKNMKSFPWLKNHATVANRTASVIGAFLTTIGIGFVWNGATHQLVINGLSLTTLAVGVWHVATQFLYQETGYQGLSLVNSMKDLLVVLQHIGGLDEQKTAELAAKAANAPAVTNAGSIKP